MFRKSLVILIAAVILLGLSVKSYALVPHLINYQGKLSNGSMTLDGEFGMIFRIYDAPLNGTLLWEEARSVQVRQGIFNVILGEVTPLDLLFDQDYWLGVEVWPDPEMIPRQRIVSVGYSYTAEDSYLLAGHAPGPGNGLDADTVDGAHAADLEESAETDGKIATHEADPEAHHTKTSSFSELTDTATDDQIPNDITIEHATAADIATTAGDADTVGGKHADELLDTSANTQNKLGGLNIGGNVGIGTTSPDVKLHIAGATKIGALKFWGNDYGDFQSSGDLRPHIGTGNFIIYSGNVGSGIERLRVQPNGNVGIGTSSPEEKLHISGDMRYDGLLKIDDLNANSHLNTYESGSNHPLIYSRYFYGHYNDLIIQAADGYYNTNIHFVTGDPPSQRMVIMDNGKVGIGTSTPESTLDVAGNVKADTVNIQNILQLEPQSTPPTGRLGALYVSQDGILYFHNGTEWQKISGPQEIKTMHKMYGGSSSDRTWSIQQTTDGGYIVTGDSYSTDIPDVTNNGGNDYYIIKLDSAGNIQWQKMYGGSSSDTARSIQQTTDGGYFVAGYSLSTDIPDVTNNGSYDYYIIKLDSAGNIQWQKMYGGSSSDIARSIQQTTDGGYIVAGDSPSTDIPDVTNNGNYDYYIIKLDVYGNL